MAEQRELLTGEQAGEVLAAVVEAAGGRLLDWRATEVDHHGDQATVSYRTRIAWNAEVGGAGQAEVVAEETLGATCGGRLPEGVAVVGDGETRIGVWQAAHDPQLPGLRTALNPAAVAALFARCGLGSGPVSVHLRAYRPLRRAVVEAVGPLGRLFLKVVPPAKARALHDRHRLLTGAGVPAPRSLGWSDNGLVVLEALHGRTLRSALRSSRPHLHPAAVTELLDRLPTELLDAPRRTSWLERTEYYAQAIGSVVPEVSSWSTQLARSIVAESTIGPIVPVHGDLYEAQLLVDHRGAITGLLDVDTAGPGDRLDDLACLLGHLSVLAQVLPANADAITGLADRCLSTFDRQADPRQLRLRVASVVLSLATGPHRVQEAGWQQTTRRRVALAESWFDSAHRVHRGLEFPLQERNHHVSTA
ncbi:aminoglycoside phosphotransferase [Kribbella flavida DSM 17836]|uniref:Aminoglycoside phosphotransferase n=1 Tax=Kribbella flavida (strain DSM 17836 / JCM 10339 / NBRC 14399) TaxID=479435 RepID=D2PKI5_KRIFD|nr:phosphotransferase [Kribbella flavida]ADB30497.1 aminoglycoside phosphotransferase [Kribbella flavida DSM 17836]